MLKKESEMRVLAFKDNLDLQYEKELTSLRDTHLGKSKREAKKMILEAKAEIIEEIYEKISEEVESLEGKKREKLLEKMIGLAGNLINYEVIYCSPEDETFISKKVKKVDIRTRKDIHGLLFETADSKQAVDLSFKNFLREFFAEKEEELHKSLFALR